MQIDNDEPINRQKRHVELLKQYESILKELQQSHLQEGKDKLMNLLQLQTIDDEQLMELKKSILMSLAEVYRLMKDSKLSLGYYYKAYKVIKQLQLTQQQAHDHSQQFHVLLKMIELCDQPSNCQHKVYLLKLAIQASPLMWRQILINQLKQIYKQQQNLSALADLNAICGQSHLLQQLLSNQPNLIKSNRNSEILNETSYLNKIVIKLNETQWCNFELLLTVIYVLLKCKSQNNFDKKKYEKLKLNKNQQWIQFIENYDVHKTSIELQITPQSKDKIDSSMNNHQDIIDETRLIVKISQELNKILTGMEKKQMKKKDNQSSAEREKWKQKSEDYKFNIQLLEFVKKIQPNQYDSVFADQIDQIPFPSQTDNISNNQEKTIIASWKEKTTNSINSSSGHAKYYSNIFSLIMQITDFFFSDSTKIVFEFSNSYVITLFAKIVIITFEEYKDCFNNYLPKSFEVISHKPQLFVCLNFINILINKVEISCLYSKQNSEGDCRRSDKLEMLMKYIQGNFHIPSVILRKQYDLNEEKSTNVSQWALCLIKYYTIYSIISLKQAKFYEQIYIGYGKYTLENNPNIQLIPQRLEQASLKSQRIKVNKKERYDIQYLKFQLQKQENYFETQNQLKIYLSEILQAFNPQLHFKCLMDLLCIFIRNFAKLYNPKNKKNLITILQKNNFEQILNSISQCLKLKDTSLCIQKDRLSCGLFYLIKFVLLRYQRFEIICFQNIFLLTRFILKQLHSADRIILLPEIIYCYSEMIKSNTNSKIQKRFLAYLILPNAFQLCTTPILTLKDRTNLQKEIKQNVFNVLQDLYCSDYTLQNKTFEHTQIFFIFVSKVFKEQLEQNQIQIIGKMKKSFSFYSQIYQRERRKICQHFYNFRLHFGQILKEFLNQATKNSINCKCFNHDELHEKEIFQILGKYYENYEVEKLKKNRHGEKIQNQQNISGKDKTNERECSESQKQEMQQNLCIKYYQQLLFISENKEACWRYLLCAYRKRCLLYFDSIFINQKTDEYKKQLFYLKRLTNFIKKQFELSQKSKIQIETSLTIVEILKIKQRQFRTQIKRLQQQSDFQKYEEKYEEGLKDLINISRTGSIPIQYLVLIELKIPNYLIQIQKKFQKGEKGQWEEFYARKYIELQNIWQTAKQIIAQIYHTNEQNVKHLEMDIIIEIYIETMKVVENILIYLKQSNTIEIAQHGQFIDKILQMFFMEDKISPNSKYQLRIENQKNIKIEGDQMGGKEEQNKDYFKMEQEEGNKENTDQKMKYQNQVNENVEIEEQSQQKEEHEEQEGGDQAQMEENQKQEKEEDQDKDKIQQVQGRYEEGQKSEKQEKVKSNRETSRKKCIKRRKRNKGRKSKMLGENIKSQWQIIDLEPYLETNTPKQFIVKVNQLINALLRLLFTCTSSQLKKVEYYRSVTKSFVYCSHLHYIFGSKDYAVKILQGYYFKQSWEEFVAIYHHYSHSSIQTNERLCQVYNRQIILKSRTLSMIEHLLQIHNRSGKLQQLIGITKKLLKMGINQRYEEKYFSIYQLLFFKGFTYTINLIELQSSVSDANIKLVLDVKKKIKKFTHQCKHKYECMIEDFLKKYDKRQPKRQKVSNDKMNDLKQQ